MQPTVGGFALGLPKQKMELLLPPDSEHVHYLINTVTGIVITSQHKTWNNQVRMRNVVGVSRYTVDNCSLHKTELIHNFMEEIGLGLVFPHLI